MINKIYFDLIFERKTEFCEYLKYFSLDNQINCSHLFLSKMINGCNGMANFFEQSTTQNIIDIQFKRTRKFVKY